MSVADTTQHHRGATTHDSRTPLPGSHTPTKAKGNWVQQHKAIAGLGGAGVVVLLLSHKGAKSGASAGAPGADAATTAQNAAAEQAAIDQAVGAGTGITSGGTGSSSGGGGDSGLGTSGAGSSGGAAAPAPTAVAPDPTAGLSGVDGLPGQPGAPGDPGQPGQPGLPGAAGASALAVTHNASKQKALPKGDLRAPSGAKKPPAKKGYTAVGTGHGGWIYKPTTAAHPPAKPVSHNPHPAKTPAPHAGAHHPAPHTPAKPTHPQRKGHGSIVKHGRFFDQAQSAHVGQSHVSADGVIHEPVTVNYGGYSETHMSHNRGEAWTDNVPGYSPPSRGVPIVRLGTPALVGSDYE